jgi:hypothetical protein
MHETLLHGNHFSVLSFNSKLTSTLPQFQFGFQPERFDFYRAQAYVIENYEVDNCTVLHLLCVAVDV